MPTFRFVVRGAKTGRTRKPVVRAIDLATARASVEAEGTLIEGWEELPFPPASPELIDQVRRLGVELPAEPTQPECVFEILRWCVVNCRDATIALPVDAYSPPWRATVEPHGFRRSKEGLRLRCWFTEPDDAPEVVTDDQTTGWHLYLIEDIEWAEVGERTFEPRAYKRAEDEAAVIEFSFP